jgi:hypothetical protein
MIRPDADLFDVCIAVDNVGDHVADRRAVCAEGDPAPAGYGVRGEGVDRGGLGVGDALHADVAKARPGKHFDLPEGRPVAGDGGPDDE